MNTVEVLTKAKSLILNGWTRWSFVNSRRCFCLMGAINAACGDATRLPYGNPTGVRAYLYVQHVVGINRKWPSYALGTWNDMMGRTVDEVLGALDQAIKNGKRRHMNGKRYKSGVNYIPTQA